MAKIELDALSIEELAALRDQATDKLAEKVAARQAELEAELEKLAQYGKVAKKSQATPVARTRKDDADKFPSDIKSAADKPSADNSSADPAVSNSSRAA